MIAVGSMIYSTQAQADAAQWRGRYMAAHDVLLAVEEYIEYFNNPREFLSTSEYSAIGERKYIAMCAAFLAYRASIEAGAPLGWAVAEEPQEVGG